MKIQLDVLSRFAHSMATCLGSGLLPPRALELSAGAGSSPGLRRAVHAAAAACQRGVVISEALESNARRFPGFVLPLIRAGEISGRQVEAFQLLQEHCQRLKPALDAVRKTWLYPLVCVVAGWSLQVVLFICFGLYSLGWQFFCDSFVKSALWAGVIWLLLRIPVLRQAIDRLMLELPLIRETLLREGTTLFFSTFRLVYDAGGLSVLQMFDLALGTVRNRALRADLAKARPMLEDHGAFEDAFNEPLLLDDQVKSSLAAGSVSGRLGVALGQIVQAETAALEQTLDKFNRIFLRLVAYGVTMSIVGTLLTCLFYPRK